MGDEARDQLRLGLIEYWRKRMLLTWPKEARALQGYFGLSDGMAILEVGCGMGFITEQLLDLLPHSNVLAIDADSAMIEAAKRYLNGKGRGRLHLHRASITTSGLPDEHLDYVLVRNLFQYLDDPISASKEMRRILKPKGRLV